MKTDTGQNIQTLPEMAHEALSQDLGTADTGSADQEDPQAFLALLPFYGRQDMEADIGPLWIGDLIGG